MVTGNAPPRHRKAQPERQRLPGHSPAAGHHQQGGFELVDLREAVPALPQGHQITTIG
jgi:hypothetical protein